MQKHKTVIVLIALVWGIFFLGSCEKETLIPEKVTFTDSVKFSVVIKPLFTNKGCTSCHGGSVAPNLAADPYKSLKDNNLINIEVPAQSVLYVQLTTNTSHIPRVNSVEVQKILEWIKEGAKNN